MCGWSQSNARSLPLLKIVVCKYEDYPVEKASNFGVDLVVTFIELNLLPWLISVSNPNLF